MSAPRPRPPRFAAVGDDLGPRRPRVPARSSDSHAVAVAVTAPTPSPLSTRATSSPGNAGQARNTTAATIFSASAGISTRRRPYQSETWPARNRLTATATA